MTSKYVQPSVDFMIPSDDGTIKTFPKIHLIVFPLPPRTLPLKVNGQAPASLTGKIYQEIYDSWFRTSNDYFHSSSEYFGYRLGQNSAFQGTQVAPYEWYLTDGHIDHNTDSAIEFRNRGKWTNQLFF